MANDSAVNSPRSIRGSSVSTRHSSPLHSTPSSTSNSRRGSVRASPREAEDGKTVCKKGKSLLTKAKMMGRMAALGKNKRKQEPQVWENGVYHLERRLKQFEDRVTGHHHVQGQLAERGVDSGWHLWKKALEGAAEKYKGADNKDEDLALRKIQQSQLERQAIAEEHARLSSLYAAEDEAEAKKQALLQRATVSREMELKNKLYHAEKIKKDREIGWK